MKRLLFSLLLIIGLFADTHAHPVAQGSLVCDVAAGGVIVEARVANEAIFLVAANTRETPPDSVDAAREMFGGYLLEKMRVFTDGGALSGVVTGIVPEVDRSAVGFTRYSLRFSGSPGVGMAASLRMEQSLLNEITFAPGNVWEATFVVRVSREGCTVAEALLLTHRAPLVCELSLPVASEAASLPYGRVLGEYLGHGFEHILVGWDHLLFMAALVLGAVTLWDLLKVVTAFTAAHTITLVLATLDVFRLPSRVVEPMIALSIVFVAVENVLHPAAARTRWRLVVAFGFGLFHGLGFAGGLLEAMSGLPVGALVAALLGFSIGVELGHQVVALPLFGLFRGLRARARENFVFRARRVASGLVSAAGCWYLVAALRG